MRCLLFVILAGYAVRCDNNYYVIEIPDNDPPMREIKKTFQVYWNVPTMQCASKRIPFENLYEKYGIIQNKNDSFRGEEISILYDPGLFPALLKNETSGKFKFRNGGVPQEGNLQKHLDSFTNVLEQSIPNEAFSGVGIIDFESWRPVFRQNFGVLMPYKDVSYEIERKRHWWWRKSWIQAEAKRRFEEAARAFMQTTLSIAKQLRPNALWGYYGFPYCFNMANNNMAESCADKVPEENDQVYWLWSESTALYPSIYSSHDLTSSQLAGLIRGRVKEADRLRRKDTPVLPYFWFRYRDGGYLSKDDLETALETLYNSNASGFIIWGSSNDVNTVKKCNSLLDYLETVVGPAVAGYTKTSNKINNDTPNNTNEVTNDPNNHVTTTLKSLVTDNVNDTIDLDPEYHWIPPENYTQDIKDHVEEEIKKKTTFNFTMIDKFNETVLGNLNDSVLIELILNNLLIDSDDGPNYANMTINDEVLPEFVGNSTSTSNYEITEEYDSETSESHINTVVTNNPLIEKYRKGTPQQDFTNNDLVTSAESTKLCDVTTGTESVNSGSTTDILTYTEEAKEFYNQDTFFEDTMTSVNNNDITTEFTDKNTYTYSMISKDEKYIYTTDITGDLSKSTTEITGLNTDITENDVITTTERTDDINSIDVENVTSLVPSTTAVDQVVVL